MTQLQTKPQARAEIARIKYQARVQANEYADRIQIFLARRFYDRKGPGGSLRIPIVRGAIALPGDFVVIQMDNRSLAPFKLDDLRSKDILEKLTVEVQHPVQVMDYLPPAGPNEPPLYGTFYVVAVRPLVSEAQAAKVALPKSKPLDMGKRPSGRYMAPIGEGFGNDGREDLWESLPTLGHVLIAGETGSGKSVFMQTALTALLPTETPGRLRVAFVSPKRSTFAVWAHVPHLWGQVSADLPEVAELVKSLLAEWNRRDRLFVQNQVQSLESYNALGGEQLPRLLLMADEMLDLALQAGARSALMSDLTSLVSKGRSHGVHVWIAATYPKADVVPKLLTENMDTRLCFRVVSEETARTLKCPGASQLPKGVPGRAMLRMGKLRIVQAYCVTEEQARAVAAKLAGVSPSQLSGMIVRLPRDQAELVMHCLDHPEYDGCFNIRRLEAAFQGTIWNGYQLRKQAQEWEDLGLLAPQLATGKGRAGSRRIRPELADLARQSVGGNGHGMAQTVLPASGYGPLAR